MPYGTKTKQQDQKVEVCVNALTASKDFNPDLKKYGNKDRKEAAIRICKAEILNKK